MWFGFTTNFDYRYGLWQANIAFLALSQPMIVGFAFQQAINIGLVWPFSMIYNRF
jgi:hypothetical protein